MNWPEEYLGAIESGEEVVSQKVRKVYEREVQWMKHPPKNFPYKFDEELGQHHIDFIERFCKQSKGRWGGQPIKLELFQKAKLQLVFGWVDINTEFRRFRQVDD